MHGSIFCSERLCQIFLQGAIRQAQARFEQFIPLSTSCVSPGKKSGPGKLAPAEPAKDVNIRQQWPFSPAAKRTLGNIFGGALDRSVLLGTKYRLSTHFNSLDGYLKNTSSSCTRQIFRSLNCDGNKPPFLKSVLEKLLFNSSNAF
jgi:hypothetical protein